MCHVVPRYHGVGNCDGVRWYATVPWYNVPWCARSLGAPHRKSIYRPLALLLSDLVNLLILIILLLLIIIIIISKYIITGHLVLYIGNLFMDLRPTFVLSGVNNIIPVTDLNINHYFTLCYTFYRMQVVCQHLKFHYYLHHHHKSLGFYSFPSKF